MRPQECAGINACIRPRRVWWGHNADRYRFPFRPRRADPVCGDALYHRYRRPVAAVRLSAKSQHAGAGAVGHRLSGRRGRRRVALPGRRGVPNVWAVGAANALAVHRLWLHVVRRAKLRRPARQPDLAGDGPGALDCRVPIRWLRAIAAGAHQSGCPRSARAMRCSPPANCGMRATAICCRAGRHCCWSLGHAGFLLARIPFAQDLAASVASGHAHGAVVTVMAFEALFVAFCLPFLRVAMSKERAELEQRIAAQTDSLTGVPTAARSSIAATRCSSAHRRTPAGGAAAVRSRSLQRHQRHGRPPGRRPRAAGFLRSRRYVGPPRRSVRPAGRRGIRLPDGECVRHAGAADRRAAAAANSRRCSLPTLRSSRRSASASPWRAKRAATCRRCWRSPTGRFIAPRPTAAIASRRRRSSGSRPQAAKPFADRLTGRHLLQRQSHS